MLADALASATSEGGRFYDSMEAQSETFSGQMATLEDNVSSLKGQLSEKLSAMLAGTVPPMVNGWLGKLFTVFSRDGAKGLIDAFGGILQELEQAAGLLQRHRRRYPELLRDSQPIGPLCGHRVQYGRRHRRGLSGRDEPGEPRHARRRSHRLFRFRKRAGLLCRKLRNKRLRRRNITQNIFITSPKALSEKEAAREFQNLSRKLALEI